MKIPATTVLLLTLSAIPAGAYPAGDAASGVSPAVVEEKASSNMLTESNANPSPQFSQQPHGVSALDLSLFGIISLGVIGLFWIRRHTSEL